MSLAKCLTSYIVAAVVFISAPLQLKAEPTASPSVSPASETGQDLEAEQIASRRENDIRQSPEWLEELKVRTVKSYFPNLKRGEALEPAQLEALARDAEKVHDYFEMDAPKSYLAGFKERYLRPFVKGLTAKKILSPLRRSKISEPVGDWTVERLVITKQILFQGAKGNIFFKLKEMIAGPHFKAASHIAVLLAVFTVAVIGIDYAIGDNAASGFLIATFAFSFKAGPVSKIVSALFQWFLGPMDEFIKRFNAQYTGGLEASINHVLDRGQRQGQAESVTNNSPKLATVAEDGTNFGHMTREDQVANWGKFLRVWVGVTKRFGQLLRDTHHHGRSLFFLPLSEEQNSTQMIETMDIKIITLGLELEAVLNPYKAAALVKGEAEIYDRISATAEEFSAITFRMESEKYWDVDRLSLAERTRLIKDLDTVTEGLRSLGITAGDIGRISSIQQRKAEALSILISSLTLNEMRQFAMAEANRNLEHEARVTQRTVRRGFRLQTRVDHYLPYIQELQRRMGFQNSGQRLDEFGCEEHLTAVAAE